MTAAPPPPAGDRPLEPPDGRRRGTSLRTRLAVVIVALVATTAAILGVGASAFVESSLREQRLSDALRQAEYDLGTLLPDAVGSPPDRAALLGSGVMDSFGARAGSQAIADFGDGDPLISSFDVRGVLESVPPDLRRIVDGGQIGFGWLAPGGRPALVVGGRMPSGPTFWFIHDTREIDEAVARLRAALLGGAAILVLLALVSATFVARGILRPIDTAAQAAARMAAGDLSVRVPSRSGDELGALAAEFNRMASALEATIGRLEGAQASNRRFVADVAHELRTPLTALVAEASLLRDGIGALPAEARRAGEMLISDVARLRMLVEDLMELSRFDAGAEAVGRSPADVAGRVRALVTARLPAARLHVPDGPLVIETDVRRFDRIVGNLLDNARTHAPGAPVEVSLEAVPGGGAGAPGATGAIVVEVADQGPGVPGGRAAVERLFGRFEKADPARPGGSGLGLAIAREHAGLLGGTLDAEPNPEGGLRFRLVLPVTEPLPGGDGSVMEAAHRGDRSELPQR